MPARTRHYALLTVLASAWTFLAGCGQDNAWTASRDDSYSDDIQKLVEDRIAEQSDTRTAAQRWEKHKAGDYQTGEDFAQDQQRAELERKREEVARKLIEAGSVRLDGEKLADLDYEFCLDREFVLKVGKRRFLRLKPN